MQKKILKIIDNFLFYDRWTCNVCGSEIFDGYFCSECESEIERLLENKCEHCGRKTAYKVKYCNSCIERNISFDVARSVFNYKSPIDKVIQNFKYQNARYIAKYFAEELYKAYLSENLECDFITFVPMSEERLNERKYNQSELLAQEFSLLSGKEVVNCVSKVKETERQANLTLKERLKNLGSSFKVDKNAVSGKKILLIDDVLTTGATTESISKQLKSANASKITVLTVASVSICENLSKNR